MTTPRTIHSMSSLERPEVRTFTGAVAPESSSLAVSVRRDGITSDNSLTFTYRGWNGYRWRVCQGARGGGSGGR